MKLIYVWIEQFRNLNHIGINLSDEFIVTERYNHETTCLELKICNQPQPVHLFDEPVTNIRGIVGRNGSGKTNLMDLFGLRRTERKRNSKENYLLLYHVEGDTFAIEGNAVEVIDRSIRGLPDINSLWGTSRIMYSFTVIRDPETYELTFDQYLQNNGVYGELEYLYFKPSGLGLKNAQKSELQESSFFSRKYIAPDFSGAYAKYHILVRLQRYQSKSGLTLFQRDQPVELKIRGLAQKSDYSFMGNKESDIPFKNQSELLDFRVSDRKKLKANWIYRFIEAYIYECWAALLAKSFASSPVKEKELKGAVSSLIPGVNSQEYLLDVLKLLLIEINGVDTTFNAFSDLILMINDFHESLFTHHEIVFPIGSEEDELLAELLSYIERQYLIPELGIQFHLLSTGEEAFVDFFATIYYGISKLEPSTDNVILLFDEPDRFMHPEWSRMLIYELVALLKEQQEERRYTYKFEIIFTTHSPFLISDLPSANVTYLERVEDPRYPRTIVKVVNEQSFASNIHTLFTRNFFMNSTMGEFARQKINDLIVKLNEKNRIWTREETEETSAFIQIIGEPLIRNKLMDMLDTKSSQLEIESLDIQIKKLQARKLELENTKNDSH